MIVIAKRGCRSPILIRGQMEGYATAPVYEVAATVSGAGPTTCGSCTFAAVERFNAPDLPDDGRRAAFLVTIAGFVVLAAAFRAGRFRAATGLTAWAAAFGAAFAALAFLNAAQRLFVAATIRARPSGLRWRFFALGGVAATPALAFRAAAHRFLCEQPCAYEQQG